MKEISKLALQLEVPSTGFNTWMSLTAAYLERFHENTLKNAGLTGYTGEVGDDSECKNNLHNTEKELAQCYYFAPNGEFLQNTALKDVIGLEDCNFFKTIYQVCVLLERNYYESLYQYRHMDISGGRTRIFFPFVNYKNQKCIGAIGYNYGADTFRSSLNFDESEYKDKKVSEYWGHPEDGTMLILPQNSAPAFLQHATVETSKDYKAMSLEEFKKEIKVISETTIEQDDGVFSKRNRNHQIEERLRIELSYERGKMWLHSPVNFSHPEGSFVFNFKNGVLA